MQRLLPATLFAGLLLLAACAAPAPVNTTSTSSSTPYVPEGSPEYGPGDTCAETYVIVYPDNARTNFSLGSSNYNNEDYCAAYPYLKWLVDNQPLFTGEDPDDRNFLRLASTYEWFATKVDSSDAATRKAYLDSALASRTAGRAAMDAEGIVYDGYLRDLREGFFFYSYQTEYDDINTDDVNEAERRQFDAFDRAFRAQPDSLEDWYVVQLFNQSAAVYEEPETRSAYVVALAGAVDDPGLTTYYTDFAAYLVRPEPEPILDIRPDDPDYVPPSGDPLVERLYAGYQAGTLNCDDTLMLLSVTTQAPARYRAVGGNPDATTTALVSTSCIQSRIDNPSTLYALAMRAYSRGNTSEGNGLFDRAIANQGSNSLKSDYYAARASKGYGNKSALIRSCLQYNSSNGNCLFMEAGLKGDAARAAAGNSVEGRAAYWCMADIYRNVAAVSSGSIASSARRAAAQYERAGPSREQYFFSTSWRPGQTVTASLGAYGRCSTRVR